MLVGAYNYLDLTPKGRNEEEIMEWVRHHDRYEEQATSSCCHRYEHVRSERSRAAELFALSGPSTG